MKKIKLTTTLLLLLQLFAFAQPGPSDGISFNGTSEYIEPDDSKHINSTEISERTIEGWFKVDNGLNKQMIYKEGGGSRGLNVFIENGFLVLGAYNNSDYTPKWLGTFFRKAINDNTWYHFSLVIENSVDATNANYSVTNNTALKFYLDGVLLNEKSAYKIYSHGGNILLGSSVNNTRTPVINSNSWVSDTNADYIFNVSTNVSNNSYFKGRIYGLRVWNSARTVTEINDNKNDLIYNVGEDDLVGALLEDAFVYFDNSDVTSTAYKSTPTNYSWLHGVNTVWSNSSNWNTNGVPPNKYDKVVINSNATNFPVLSSDILIGELSLQNNTKITIPSGVTLTVAYKFTNNGEIIVEDGGSFIFEPNLAVNGDFEVKRNSPTLDQNFYSYWSTPVLEADSSIATAFANYPTIYGFNANQNPTDWFVNGTTDFIVGHGYAVRQDNATPESQNITFKGTANNGNIDVELFYNPSDVDATDFGNNLLGNPYPSALDWKTFNQDKDNTDILNGTVYIWSQSIAPNGPNLVSDYITCTNSACSSAGYNGEIASGQGFFVNRKDPTANPGVDNLVTFKNSHRVKGNNNQFFRSANTTPTNQSWFSLTKNNMTESIYVGFQQDATAQYDDLFDGIYNNSNTSLGFYSLIGEEKMAVQALADLTEDTTVNLGYRYNSAGTIIIEIDQELIDPSFDIILENKYTNQFTDLRETTYSFQVSENTETEVNDQFVLHFRSSALTTNDDLIKENNVNVYTKNNHLMIQSAINVSNVNVFDINGKLVLKTNKTENFIGNLNSGVYIIQVELNNNQIINKKIIF